MCKAMNRSFFNVILGGFGGEAAAPAAGAAAAQGQERQRRRRGLHLGNAETVVIVPGYGLAVARRSTRSRSWRAKLATKGVTVKYAIHPVAGRMPAT